MTTNLSISECTVTFTSEKHLDQDYPERMRQLHGTLTHPTLGELATVTALQITRRMDAKYHGDFREMLDEESRDLREFSVGLFDRYGNVRPWIVGGGSRSGSGIWGTELSIGDMLYVQRLMVKAEYRRNGVGSKLLQNLLESLDKGYMAHAFAFPTPIRFTGSDRERIQAQDNIISFYHTIGFRRVGITEYFAYSPNPAHPSRNLPAFADPEHPPRAFDLANLSAPKLTDDQIKARYPMHYAIATNKTLSILATLYTAHVADAGCVRKRDENGLTPVCIAVAYENILALRVLLLLDPVGIAEDLNNTQNSAGMTPLEDLQMSMQSTREFDERILGWDGYPDVRLECEYFSAKAMGLPLVLDDKGNVMEEGEYVKMRKYGCTCGKCTGGWMSPRMRFCLSTQAALQKDDMVIELDLFKSRQPCSASELMCSGLDYIPPHIRQEMDKSFYVGLYTSFRAIHQILEANATSVPTPQVVRSFALGMDVGAVHIFMYKGGKMEHALDAIVHMAWKQSRLGNGTSEEMLDAYLDGKAGGEKERDERVRRFRAMPRCVNDLAFELVRSHVGLAGGVNWGPYRERED